MAQIASIDKTKQQNPLDKYYEVTDNMMLYPYPLGLVNRKGEETKLNAGGKILSDNYIDALSQGLSLSKYLQEIHLNNTALSTKGAT